MSDPKQDLRASEDAIQEDAREVLRLEEAKSTLDPGDPEVDAISEHVERIAASIAVKSRAEREISKEIEPGE